MMPTSAIMVLMMQRRVRRLHRLGPVSMTTLLAKIEAEQQGAVVVHLHRRRLLTLPAAARQARAA